MAAESSNMALNGADALKRKNFRFAIHDVRGMSPVLTHRLTLEWVLFCEEQKNASLW